MSAVFTRLLLKGKPGKPDIYGHVRRQRWHTVWFVTEGPEGRILRSDAAWTLGGAWRKANAAAHDPNLYRRGAR